MLTATALELIVRDLRPDDWAEVAAIYRDGIRGGMATFETEVPQWDAWHETHPLRVVAEIDERVVGWAAVARTSRRWAYRGVGESSVYIARDTRGKGIGRSLLEALIAKSERAGFWTLEASIFPENEASLKLHDRVGFRVVGVQKRIAKRDGLWRDTVLMERRSEVIV